MRCMAAIHAACETTASTMRSARHWIIRDTPGYGQLLLETADIYMYSLTPMRQEAPLSQRGRATLCVVGNVAKLLKVI